jgi:hypothetical protein
VQIVSKCDFHPELTNDACSCLAPASEIITA